MVAELVETSRLWGRTAARIDPKWVEPLAGHLLKRTYSEPRWDREPRVGRRDRARDAVRAADRRGPHGRLRADRPAALARAVHPLRAGRGRLGDAARVLRGERAAARGGRGARAPRAAPRHPRRATRRSSTSTTRGSRPTSCPPRTSTAGGGTRAATDPDRAHLHARAAGRRAGRGGDRPARVAADVEAGRPDARAQLPVRAGHRQRRRDRPRAAAAARAAARGPLRVARAGPARRAGHDADPLAAEGAAPAAGAGAGDRGRGARGAAAAARAAARRDGARDRAAARRARPARRVGSFGGCRRTCG